MPSTAIGAMRERLVVQRNDPPTLSVSSLTRTVTIATATTIVPHGYVATDYVTIAGASPAGWNAKWKIATVPSTTTFTFVVTALSSPATGTITVVYTSNAQGGQGSHFWRTMDSIAAEMIPLGTMERLQMQAVHSSVQYRFRVRVRPDLEPTMRVLWLPSWVHGEPRKTLAITGPPLPCEDGRRFMFLECSEGAS